MVYWINSSFSREESSVIIWSSSRLIAEHYKNDSKDGLHMGKTITKMVRKCLRIPEQGVIALPDADSGSGVG